MKVQNLPVVVGFGRLNVIDVAEPPLTTVAVPAVEPLLVQAQTAVCEQEITILAEPPLASSDKTTLEPEDGPPSGVQVALLLLPYRFCKDIAPDATPANVRTAVSPRDMVAVLDRPSSVFTFASEMAPED